MQYYFLVVSHPHLNGGRDQSELNNESNKASHKCNNNIKLSCDYHMTN